MSARLAMLLALVFAGCASEPITAELLDPGWKNDVGWPADTMEEGTATLITDPSGTVGALTATLYDGDCIVAWSLVGDRTTCRDCEFAFDVEMEVVEDTCGMGTSFRGTLEVGNGAIYISYSRLASYERVGNTLTFDSREDDSDVPEPYYDPYYYGDYYSPYSIDYYGTLTLLAR